MAACCFFLFCKSVRSTRVNCENILFVEFLYCVVYFTTFSPHGEPSLLNHLVLSIDQQLVTCYNQICTS